MHMVHTQDLYLCDSLFIMLAGSWPALRIELEQGSTLSYEIYGVSRVRSRGNRVVNRTLGAPVSCISKRSRPIANPPCGGMP